MISIHVPSIRPIGPASDYAYLPPSDERGSTQRRSIIDLLTAVHADPWARTCYIGTMESNVRDARILRAVCYCTSYFLTRLERPHCVYLQDILVDDKHEEPRMRILLAFGGRRKKHDFPNLDDLFGVQEQLPALATKLQKSLPENKQEPFNMLCHQWLRDEEPSIMGVSSWEITTKPQITKFLRLLGKDSRAMPSRSSR